VQHAVRHQPVTAEHGLFVQHAVRSSQLDAQVLSAALNAQNSASAGYSSLLNPFALGAPGTDSAGVQRVAAAEPDAPAKPVEAVAAKPGVVDQKIATSGLPAGAEEPIEGKRSAVGFKAQLGRFANDRTQGSRPVTRATAAKI
jgi:large repetitive protein